MSNPTPSEAPYIDPDGYPSWQPDPAARAIDAWARRFQIQRDRYDEAQVAVDRAYSRLRFAERERDAAAAAKDALLSTRPSS